MMGGETSKVKAVIWAQTSEVAELRLQECQGNGDTQDASNEVEVVGLFKSSMYLIFCTLTHPYRPAAIVHINNFESKQTALTSRNNQLCMNPGTIP